MLKCGRWFVDTLAYDEDVASEFEKLSPDQRTLVDQWWPGAVVERDHSWGLVDRAVLEVRHGPDRFVVKAGGPGDHHMARELHAHLHWVGPWASRRRAPRLLHHDAAANLLVTQYLPGHLVEGTQTATETAAYRQAGELLSLLHNQLSFRDGGYEAAEDAKSLAWLDKPHRIGADVETALRAEIASWPTPPTVVVPTHGDWQPRNWLVHKGVVSVIDFGRAALRPAMSDFARLSAKEFEAITLSRPPSSTGTAPIRGNPAHGTATRSARRSARLCGQPGRRRGVRGAWPPDDRRRADRSGRGRLSRDSGQQFCTSF